MIELIRIFSLYLVNREKNCNGSLRKMHRKYSQIIIVHKAFLSLLLSMNFLIFSTATIRLLIWSLDKLLSFLAKLERSRPSKTRPSKTLQYWEANRVYQNLDRRRWFGLWKTICSLVTFVPHPWCLITIVLCLVFNLLQYPKLSDYEYMKNLILYGQSISPFVHKCYNFVFYKM